MTQEHKSNFELWSEEQEFLKPVKREHPEWFKHPKDADIAAIYKSVGIELPEDFNSFPKGYVKFHPFDFIVEEVGEDRKITTVENGECKIENYTETPKTIYATLVKLGASTLDVTKELAKYLSIDPKQIGYAGIKDAVALTAQRISIRGVRAEKLEALPKNINWFLKDIEYSNGALNKGQLFGNKFTIFVRTEESLDSEKLEKDLRKIESEGFWNFFWFQRFGNRLLGHKMGASVMRGNYTEAVRNYLVQSGMNDLPIYKAIRDQANKSFGNWTAMKKVFMGFPFSMRNELLMLDYLIENGKDYQGALKQVPEQIAIWVQAFSSFLFNKMLSKYALEGQTPPNVLPIASSNIREERELYGKWIKEERVPMGFDDHLKPFYLHIQYKSIKIPTKIYPKIHSFQVVPEGLVVSFTLDKGAYATTFLSHLFRLYGIESENIKDITYDIKALLKNGNSVETFERLKNFIPERQAEAEINNT
ncbi:MAG: tRNA pseudouridine(13) synthase TruD [Candidatus Doudnabacteria bacterium]|nr:tRNA pseudouridine(13) synthase TruD [Candidatus Doudnabacteria bacterium]